MNAKSAALRDEILSLPHDERAEFAVELLASLDDDVPDVNSAEVDHAWGVEMVRRSQQVASGEVRTLEWDAVLERVAENRRLAVSFEVAYHPLAVAEIVNAEDWYERQNEGLGDRFLAAIEDAVRRTSRWPQSGTPVAVSDDGMVLNRKVPVGGFPWAVGYEVVDETVLVLAVFHQRRRPGYWTIRNR